MRLRPGGEGPDAAGAVEFYLQAGLPHWRFAIQPGVWIEQAIMMPHDQNTVHLRYCLIGAGAATLRLRPWLDVRPHEGLLSPEQHRTYATIADARSQLEFALEDTPHLVRLRATGAPATFVASPSDWNQVPYSIEQERGYDALGSMHSPGTLTVPLVEHEPLFVTASSEPWAVLDALTPVAAWELELARRETLLQSSDASLQAADTFLLPLAADQFIVRPITRIVDEAQARAAGDEPRTVIAGYPLVHRLGPRHDDQPRRADARDRPPPRGPATSCAPSRSTSATG